MNRGIDPVRGRRILQVCAVMLVLGSTACAVVWSLRWPLVGDSSLMHYVVFLMGHGLTPYRDIVDINLPGTYFFEALGMRLLGGGALAWRVYDFLLLGAAAGAMMLLARRGRTAGLLAAGLFALIHLADGMAQTGQRDLLVAVLLLWAYVASFAGQVAIRESRKSGRVLLFVAALLIGVTATIKPSYLPLGIMLPAMACWDVSAGDRLQIWVAWLAGLLCPMAICAVWLGWIGALPAFMEMTTSLLPFHAELGRRSLLFLLTHATAPLLPLVVVWLAMLLAARRPITSQKYQMLAGGLMALAAYIAQGKGYPYHRYPLLGLLLVMMQQDFCTVLAQTDRRLVPRVLALLALAWQCGYLAPHSARLVRSFRPDTPFQDGLSAELQRIGSGISLSGNVQCLDTFGGCVNVLYNLRLVQASGYLYDCYAFEAESSAAERGYRERFLAAYRQRSPEVLVLTDQFCFDERGGFDRVRNWPAFATELATHYTQQVEWKSPIAQHWWSRSESTPQFRIYLRRH